MNALCYMVWIGVWSDRTQIGLMMHMDASDARQEQTFTAADALLTCFKAVDD